MDIQIEENNELRNSYDAKSYNECLYCGEPVEAPNFYCCLEHEESRSLE